MRTTTRTKQYVAASPPALVVSCSSQQNHCVLLFYVTLAVTMYFSTNYNSFGVFAWTTKTNISFRRPYSTRKEVYLFYLYLNPLSSEHRSISITGRSRTCGLQYSTTTSDDTIRSDIDANTTSHQRPLCFYRSPINNNRWKPRIELQNLSIGQELQGVIVQEKLTNTTTGPKVWLDVGVCRWSSKVKPYIKKDTTTNNNNINATSLSLLSLSNTTSGGGWKICTALLRLGMSNYVKESVIRKKITRLRNKPTLTVYVSRIFINEGRFDVVLTPEEVPSSTTHNTTTPTPTLQSVSKLNVDDEITGTVTKLVDYGVFIKLDGYNRGGLLHIRQVADLYQTYIDKKQGLIDAGLNLKSRVRLQVIEKNKKRILLDFTKDVKQIAVDEQRQEQEQIERQQNELRAQLQQQREKATKNQGTAMVESNSTITSLLTSDSTDDTIENMDTLVVQDNVRISLDDDTNEDISHEEEEVDDDEEEYDNYDEERDIEDALGLGMY